MSTAQKVIKYLAIAFGVFLSVTIISSIVMALMYFTNILIDDRNIPNNDSNKNNEINLTKYYNKEFKIDEVKELDIEFDISKFDIKKGDKLSVEAYNVDDKFLAYIQDDTFFISENIKLNKKIFKSISTPNITLYIPENFKFDNIDIKSGAGNISIDEITTNRLEVNMGAGNFEAKNIKANETKIQGGVGNLSITKSDIGKLEYKAGVGDSKIESVLNNNSKIESGVGNIKLTLIDERVNYYFDIETGIGNITLDGNKIKNGSFGDKEAKNIKIEGGIGNIDITSVN